MSPDVVRSWLESIVSADHVQRLGWVVVHSLWQAAAVAAVLAVALRAVPRRSAAALQARYVLAVLALCALPAASVATYALVAPPAMPRTGTDAVPGDVAPAGAASARADRGERVVVLPAAIAAAVDRAAPAARIVPATPASEDARAAVALLARRAAAAVAPWLPWCAALWMAGACVAAGRLGVGWWLTRRLVAEAVAPADAWWQARLDRWHDALGIARRVRLLASARIDVPAVVGWLEPVVVWPLAALTGMPADQIDAILAHELAHVRRHDVFVNLLQSCLETLYFHHPAAWWISAQVRAEREHCADDLAVRVLAAARAGSRLSYATALVALEERRQATALAVAADGGSLVDRVRRLAGIEPAAGHPARLAAAVLALAVIAASAATVAMGGRVARADAPAEAGAFEVPKDTNTIKSLTPEQARQVVREFPGVTVRIVLKGESKARLERCLPLNGLQSLHAEVAKELAAWGKGPLQLNGLTTLSTDAAQALAEQKWGLILDGLPTISADMAQVLAGDERTLGIRPVVLSLGGVTTLSADVAEALAGFGGLWLLLDGVTTLPVDAAEALAGFKADRLSLDGVTSLSPDAAEALAGMEQPFTLLHLNGLMTLPVDVAEALAGFKGALLTLNGVTALSPDAARAIAGFTSPAGGHLHLDGLTSLDAATATALARFKGAILYLDRVVTLSADTAKALAGVEADELSLKGLATLDADTARALAAFQGRRLVLDGLTTLTADAAAALAGFRGDHLFLSGLTTFTADAAEALAAFRGNLVAPAAVSRIGGHIPLTPATARLACACAQRQQATVSLPGVTAIDTPDAVEVATILATTAGRFALPNLEKISSKTLTALLRRKGNVEIPPVAGLEFIPEPDGSPTEDFVAPAWLQSRQLKR